MPAVSRSKKRTPKREAEPAAELDVTHIARHLADEVRREGAVVLASALRDAGVTKKDRDAVLTSLAQQGLEVGKRSARIPLAAQLEARLGDGGAVPLRSIDEALAGATKREALAAVDVLCATRKARLVVRSAELVLMPTSEDTLSSAELDKLESNLESLRKTLALARKKKASVLRSDVERLFVAPSPARAKVAPPRPPSLDDVLGSLSRHRESSGLTFVPTLVRALGGAPARDAVHDALLRGVRAGVLELRPESGMGTLSPEDVTLCLAGPQGSRLSWVRRIEEPS